jgi:hypothetical protein
MKPIFDAQGVPREALAALTLFTAAAKKEKAPPPGRAPRAAAQHRLPLLQQ